MKTLTEEQKEQLREAKQLARAQSLSMTLAHRRRGGPIWLFGPVYQIHDKDFDYTFRGSVPDVLAELRRRRG